MKWTQNWTKFSNFSKGKSNIDFRVLNSTHRLKSMLLLYYLGSASLYRLTKFCIAISTASFRESLSLSKFLIIS